MEVKSLVGYGVSSDSEEEDEGESSIQTEKEKEAEAEGERKIQNFQQESVSAATASSSESEREEDQEKPAEAVYPGVLNSKTPSPFSAFTHKLTPPPLGGGSLGGFSAGSSVFANPFKERAEARLNVLRKHVPLTLQARPIQIGGKRICVAYRKNGRCCFGIRCKFAHDSDLQSSTGFPTEPAGSDIRPLDQTKSNPDYLRTSDYGTSALERGKEEEEEEEESRKRKKHRVGFSDTLIPPKRMLKQYAMQKNKL
ncbi:uncharacterized protein si:ch211-113e8.11 isoform X2 [Colossoma macropomum]|uniref:uncharacterized protein si:ch211-113e8.11 isoform X1 n=1 Tax=Colossoma macropomum TaxID=42526 RepID=UPI0018656628|nr:uncharacterized protein si:ch211-113e8.11 isoform X1 [Colossoma macropomum]XP_036430745.1 uncharacterized protein si:ch211-113e8.11 isoform X2 [Colossoma macropomum]